MLKTPTEVRILLKTVHMSMLDAYLLWCVCVDLFMLLAYEPGVHHTVIVCLLLNVYLILVHKVKIFYLISCSIFNIWELVYMFWQTIGPLNYPSILKSHSPKMATKQVQNVEEWKFFSNWLNFLCEFWEGWNFFLYQEPLLMNNGDEAKEEMQI